MIETSAAGGAWTCPFCALACDHLGAGPGDGTLALQGGECPRARRALAQFASVPADASAQVDGRLCDMGSAVAGSAMQERDASAAMV